MPPLDQLTAVPIVAEVDESLTLDPADMRRKISRFTKAIIPVHLRGVPCQMDELMTIAREHELPVLEDVAQATTVSDLAASAMSAPSAFNSTRSSPAAKAAW